MGAVRATGCLRSVGEELRPMSSLAASAVPIGAELAMRKKRGGGFWMILCTLSYILVCQGFGKINIFGR